MLLALSSQGELGLPRGLPLDLVPLSALGRSAKLLPRLSSSLTGRYLSSGGVCPDGIGERGVVGNVRKF